MRYWRINNPLEDFQTSLSSSGGEPESELLRGLVSEKCKIQVI
ncbi:hypothetical protein CLOSTMETH_03112 [[Clostridium] methylpentosum DSM 5476]|uniref:Uncharacterized protein n=1 Tax=[Clostridium] methylpentosum DSM 5476 TaxID=537013 RepID=C0EGW8_9FIRM|nr:hypothetical protein CLOSTMETH_03112 [[Clostridium] methylpentosum DSM 5476]